MTQQMPQEQAPKQFSPEQFSLEQISLEQVENDAWGDPPVDATRLVATVYALRRKPIGALNAEDLRLLISQREGLAVLVPRALGQLEHDPLLAGDLFPGDLLAALRRVPADYWSAHPAQRATLDRVVTAAESAAESQEPPAVTRPDS